MYIVVKDNKSVTHETLQELLDAEGYKPSAEQQVKDLLFNAVAAAIAVCGGKTPTIVRANPTTPAPRTELVSVGDRRRKERIQKRKDNWAIQRSANCTTDEMAQTMAERALPPGFGTGIDNVAIKCSEELFIIFDRVMSTRQISAHAVYDGHPELRRKFGSKCGQLSRLCKTYKIHDLAYISATFELPQVNAKLFGAEIPLRARIAGRASVFTTHPQATKYWLDNRERLIGLRKDNQTALSFMHNPSA